MLNLNTNQLLHRAVKLPWTPFRLVSSCQLKIVSVNSPKNVTFEIFQCRGMMRAQGGCWHRSCSCLGASSTSSCVSFLAWSLITDAVEAKYFFIQLKGSNNYSMTALLGLKQWENCYQ